MPSTRSLAPQGFTETLCHVLSSLPGWPGWVAYRKLKRRIMRRTMADFESVLKALGPGDVCCDLGANVGSVTLRIAATGATVHAFEPDPETFSQLVANVGHLPNVHCHQVAAGDDNRMVTLLRPEAYLTESTRNAASKATAVVPRKDGEAFFEAGAVEMIDFAAFLKGLDRPAALVKIDIEGAEWMVLDKVLAEAPDRFRAMFVETHERFDFSLLPAVKRKQALFRSWTAPYINLYWA